MANQIPKFDVETLKRFKANYEVGRKDSCWLYKGTIDKDKYGKFSYKRKGYKPHRIAYKLHYGTDPGELFVCHKCDNPPCVNPHHLFLGTTQDNMDDMKLKGRHWAHKGENQANSKLTEDDVKEIRVLRDHGGCTFSDLSNMFGVCQANIYKICKRHSWKHI
jgi:hypothetical protein